MYIKDFEFGFIFLTCGGKNSLSTKAGNCKAQTLGSVDITIGDKDLEFLTMA